MGFPLKTQVETVLRERLKSTHCRPWAPLTAMPAHAPHRPELVGALRAEKNGHSLWMRVLLDDLVGEGEDRRRHGETERPGGIEIDRWRRRIAAQLCREIRRQPADLAKFGEDQSARGKYERPQTTKRHDNS
jgi:hypothetical protein